MLETVISGFQDGADIGGIDAAKKCDILTGGEMPKGFRTESGPKPHYAELYNAKENNSTSYLPRTRKNVINAEITIISSTNKSSSGTKKTIQYCIANKKHYLVIDPYSDPTEKALGFLKKHKPATVNIAGNRESVSKGIRKATKQYLTTVFTEYNDVF